MPLITLFLPHKITEPSQPNRLRSVILDISHSSAKNDTPIAGGALMQE